MYKVFKDHAELAEYKTLAAAKKLAEKEHGEVFCNGQKVYPAEQDDPVDIAPAIAPEQKDEAQDSTGATQPEGTDSTGAIQEEEKYTKSVEGRYRITSLMNIRLRPALKADIVGIAQPGTVVTVTGIQNDWLAVRNGAETVFILYGGGRYATRL